jgi:hypothetical protein
LRVALRGADGGCVMNKKAFSVLAATLWAGAAMASASPADALVYGVNIVGGNYLSCSQNYVADPVEACGYVFNYAQTIRFITTTCNSGACAAEGNKYVEQVYTSGRKTASHLSTCGYADPEMLGPVSSIWAVGSCAC